MKLEENENRLIIFKGGKSLDLYFRVKNTEELYEASKVTVINRYRTNLYNHLFENNADQIKEDIKNLQEFKERFLHNKELCATIQKEIDRHIFILSVESTKEKLKNLLQEALDGSGEAAFKFLEERSMGGYEYFEFVLLE